MLEPIAPPQAAASKDGQASNPMVVNHIPPSPIGDLADPVYPAAALAAHAGSCAVFVTITIDAKGEVTEVSPSWQRFNMPNRFSEQFLAAVEDAVRGWRFEPARNVYWQKVAGEDYRYISTETIPVRTDIKFTFEASGGVH